MTISVKDKVNNSFAFANNKMPTIIPQVTVPNPDVETIENKLLLYTFNTPTSWAVMSERGDADCAFEMRNGVKDLQIIMNDIMTLIRENKFLSLKSKVDTVKEKLSEEYYLPITFLPLAMSTGAPISYVPAIYTNAPKSG
jgi:hypothetical protein